MDSDFRIRSGILYVLLQASTEGHTYLPEEELTRRTGQLLEVGEEQIEKQYMDLAIERKIIMKQGRKPDADLCGVLLLHGGKYGNHVKTAQCQL